MGAGGGLVGASRLGGPVLVAPLQQRHHLEGGGRSELSEPCGGDALWRNTRHLVQDAEYKWIYRNESSSDCLGVCDTVCNTTFRAGEAVSPAAVSPATNRTRCRESDHN
jgi:hypothetical protein